MITSIVPKLPFINKEQTIDFYVNRLGFKLASDYGDYFIILPDNAELHFFAYPTLNPTKSDFMILSLIHISEHHCLTRAAQ